jgi:hypothetical protein
MAALVAAAPESAAIDRRPQTAPGVGPIVAATLLAGRSRRDRPRAEHVIASDQRAARTRAFELWVEVTSVAAAA